MESGKFACKRVPDDKRGKETKESIVTHWILGASISTSGRNERTRMDTMLTNSSLIIRPHRQETHPMAVDDYDLWQWHDVGVTVEQGNLAVLRDEEKQAGIKWQKMANSR